MNPTFSVIIPTRNRADLVTAQVERILLMSGCPEQIVVVDDGSTDGTSRRLGAMAGLEVVSGGGEGPSAARNRGITVATGDWLVFLDDDDVPFDAWMDRFRCLVDAHPESPYVSVGHLTGAGDLAPVPTGGSAFHRMGAAFSAGSFAVRADLVREVGGFDERLSFGEFTDLALRVFELMGSRGLRAVHQPEPTLQLAPRPRSQRSSMLPDAYIESGLVSLEKNEHLWRRDPDGHRLQLTTLGVAMIRSGRLRDGRRLLWRSVRLRATPAMAARAVAATIPAVARRVWSEER